MQKTILIFPLLTFFIFALVSCSNQHKNETKSDEITKNEVIVLGMIHSGHKTSKKYGIDALTNIIREINPDYILTEIPPDRFETALDEFHEKDTITESRVVRFPEYVHVIFPLTKEMDFEIIPTAGWTKEMADARSKRLKEIRQDSSWTEKWHEYLASGIQADSALTALGDKDDPYIINSEAYDKAVEIELSVYNHLFNDELGDGGWDNINEKHYAHIESALNAHSKEGKRILITYGAGHKGWFLRKLKLRDDINLLDAKPFIDKATQVTP